jgi:hypothetical protein
MKQVDLINMFSISGHDDPIWWHYNCAQSTLMMERLRTIYLYLGVTIAHTTYDLQLPMQSVPITTDVVSSNLDQGEVYNIMC